MQALATAMVTRLTVKLVHRIGTGRAALRPASGLSYTHPWAWPASAGPSAAEGIQ